MEGPMDPMPSAVLAAGPGAPAANANGAFPATNLNKRGPVACKRCRRAKTKCLHAGAPPCRSCSEANMASECTFPPKGTSFIDRAPAKRPRTRGSSEPDDAGGAPGPLASVSARQPGGHRVGAASANGTGHPSPQDVKPALVRASVPPSPAEWAHGPVEPLPPPELIGDACEIFFVRVNQCAFLHKPTFLARLRSPHPPAPVLVLAMCALAARFVPALADVYGGAARSADIFASRARGLLTDAALLDGAAGGGAVGVDTVQAAYLLGLADWSACRGRRAWMIQGIAIRMAFLLGLHRDETHRLPENASPQDVIRAEEAKRTFWTLYVNDCTFSSGVSRPPSILPSEVTAPLPCDEDAFAFGTPTPPAYLPQLRHPSATGPGAQLNGSMFARMVQAAELWGRAARWACAGGESLSPEADGAEYGRLREALDMWETFLPPQLQYSKSNLLVYFQRHLESSLVYNHATFHAAEIVLRRPFLPYIIRSLAPDSQTAAQLPPLPSPWTPAPSREFWRVCGLEMFTAAFKIIDIIFDFTQLTHAHYSSLSPHLGFSTFLACATLTYVWRWPWLFPERAYDVHTLVTRTTELLGAMGPSWPMAHEWVRALRQPLAQARTLDEVVNDDVRRDREEGILRQGAMRRGSGGGGGGANGMDGGMDGDGGDGPLELARRQGARQFDGPSLPPLQLPAQHHGARGAHTPVNSPGGPQRGGAGAGGSAGWRTSAPALHALAVCASESLPHPGSAAHQQQQQQQQQQPSSAVMSPGGAGPDGAVHAHHHAAHMAAHMAAQHQHQQQHQQQHQHQHQQHQHQQHPGGHAFGGYSEMPFGDPSEPQSFGDVVAFMEGAEGWTWRAPGM